jgi:uncharacterized protein (DUF362 family)
MEDSMNRRTFLKLAAGASALSVFPFTGKIHAAAQDRTDFKSYAPGPDAKVALAGVGRGAPEQTLRQAVRTAAEAATDFSWLSRGDAVFIKPVLNSGNPYPATTSPHAIAAMVELLREKGAGKVIVGDMSGVEHVRFSPEGLTGSSRALMEASGMAGIVQSAGAELHFFEEAGWDAFYEEGPPAGSHWKKGIMMPNILRDVQHIVLMPRCGRHVLAGCTLGLKAVVGYWRHDTRLEYHHDAATLHEKTAEANAVETLRKKQRLVVSAADKLLATFGPDKGYVSEPHTGLMIASTSVVAHDMVSLAWLLESRQHIPESEKNGFLDSGSIFPWFANHVVVGWLGGWGQAFSSESFTKNNLFTVWDDRVLNQAYRIFHGVPRIALVEANDAIPGDLLRNLHSMTALPG